MPRTASKATQDFGTFRDVPHPEARPNQVFAAARLNDSSWFRKDMAPPRRGIANGPAFAGSSKQSGEGDPALRVRALIEPDFVDCMIALPGQRFYSTQIPVCL